MQSNTQPNFGDFSMAAFRDTCKGMLDDGILFDLVADLAPDDNKGQFDAVLKHFESTTDPVTTNVFVTSAGAVSAAVLRDLDPMVVSLRGFAAWGYMFKRIVDAADSVLAEEGL